MAVTFGSLSAQQRLLLERLLDDDGVGRTLRPIPRRGGDRGRAPLSFGQERLYFLARLRPGSAAYTVAGALRMRGEVDADVLRRSIELLVARHEVLRTGFVQDAGGVVEQVIHEPASVRVELPVLVADDPMGTARSLITTAGFDLSQPPLLRAWLLRAGEADWLLALCVHHLVVDGWSLAVLVEELGTAYAALLAGRRPDLPTLPVQYADFAAWQRSQPTGTPPGDTGPDDAALAHWRGQLAGASAVELPTDRPRPASPSDAGDWVPVEWPAPLVARLRDIADGAQATLFMVLVAALSVVLGRWAGTADVVLAAPVAGRSRAELDGLAGFFVNTLPLRIRPQADRPFGELLRHVRQVCTDAYAHQDVPFEQMLGPGAAGLVRHAVTLHNTPPVRLQLPGVDAEAVPLHTGTAKFDLEIQVAPNDDGGLSGWLEYATDLFDRETVLRLLASLRAVLDAVVAAAADQPLWRLPLLPAAERSRVLSTFSGGRVRPLTGPELPSWFEAQVDDAPQSCAVLVDATGEAISYADLDARANRVASALLARGVGVEDRVGVCFERGADLIVSVLAVLKAGAAYLPLDPSYPPARLAQLVADGAPQLVLTDSAELFEPGPAVLPLAVLTESVGPAVHRPAVTLRPDNAAYVLFTSGSTGRPKGAVNTHAGIVNRLRWMQHEYRLGGTDRVLQKTPIGFDVSVWELIWPLVTGATLVFARPGGHRDPEYLHDVIDRLGVTTCHFVPSMLRVFVETPSGRHPSLRRVICSGEELPARLAARVLDRWPATELHNLYGPAEAAIDVTAYRVCAPVPPRVPIGRPITGAELFVLDGRGQPRPIGVPGELFIAGVQLARCYAGRPDLTAERFVPHPFDAGRRLYATGDRARWLADGNLEFLGRLDHQVKIRGNRVEPGEVEAALLAHPLVTDALVMAVPDRDGQPQLVGYLTGTGVDGVREYLSARLPEYLVPSRLFALDAWPIGPNGKLDRSALPRPDGSRPAETKYQPPRTPQERAVAAVWSRLLGLDRVGVHDDFFELGGHSLLATRVVAQLRAELGVELRVDQLFTARRLADLARVVTSEQATAQPRPTEWPVLRRLDREQYRVTPRGERG
jgi:amino acid adenylation domain-containing protein